MALPELPLWEGQMSGFSPAIALDPATCLQGKSGCFGIPGGKALSFPGGDEIPILQCQFCLQLSGVCFCLPAPWPEVVSTDPGWILTTLGNSHSQENECFGPDSYFWVYSLFLSWNSSPCSFPDVAVQSVVVCDLWKYFLTKSQSKFSFFLQ